MRLILGTLKIQFFFQLLVFINSSNVGFPLKSKIEQIHFYIHFDLPLGGGGGGAWLISKLVRAPDLKSGGHRFKSHSDRQLVFFLVVPHQFNSVTNGRVCTQPTGLPLPTSWVIFFWPHYLFHYFLPLALKSPFGEWSIHHFRVPLFLCFKVSLSAKPVL